MLFLDFVICQQSLVLIYKLSINARVDVANFTTEQYGDEDIIV